MRGSRHGHPATRQPERASPPGPVLVLVSWMSMVLVSLPGKASPRAISFDTGAGPCTSKTREPGIPLQRQAGMTPPDVTTMGTPVTRDMRGATHD